MNAKLKALCDAIVEKKEDLSDLEAITDENSGLIKRYCDYSNAVVMEQYRITAAIARANSPEDIRVRREQIDAERRNYHNLAVGATLLVNNMCEYYGVEKFYDGPLDNDLGGDYTSETRGNLAAFIGDFVDAEFQKGIGAYGRDPFAKDNEKNYIPDKEVRQNAGEYEECL